MTFLKKLAVLGIILALSTVTNALFTTCDPTPSEDEVLLVVHPHVRDHVFVIQADFAIDGQLIATQGCCNANMRSPLTDDVFLQLLPEDVPEYDLTKLSVSLSVQNEPFPTANGTEAMNTAQASLIPVKNEIFLPAKMGERYELVLRDNPTDGYYLTVLKGTLLSPDGRYSAKAESVKQGQETAMVEITLHDTWGLEPDFVFSPVRALDFWGLYWEENHLAVDSSDVGTLFYGKDDAGQWIQVPRAWRGIRN